MQQPPYAHQERLTAVVFLKRLRIQINTNLTNSKKLIQIKNMYYLKNL